MRFLVNRASLSGNSVRLTSSLLATACIAFSTLSAGAEETLIYKSVAGDGTVEFTDKAAPNAVIITPSPLNIVESPASKVDQGDADLNNTTTAQTSGDAVSDTVIDPDLITITSVTINSPAHQETLIDHQGPIWVAIQTAPATNIPAGLTAEVTLDGKRVVTGSSARLPIDVPSRGTHQLHVKIVDLKGKVVAESAKHDIHIKERVSKSAK